LDAPAAKNPKPSRPAQFREAPYVRRGSLVQAATRAIAKHGFAGTTIGVIGAETRVSPGLSNHHFGDELLLL
jgi:AcrR family transcriptional regulator